MESSGIQLKDVMTPGSNIRIATITPEERSDLIPPEYVDKLDGIKLRWILYLYPTIPGPPRVKIYEWGVFVAGIYYPIDQPQPAGFNAASDLLHEQVSKELSDMLRRLPRSDILLAMNLHKETLRTSSKMIFAEIRKSIDLKVPADSIVELLTNQIKLAEKLKESIKALVDANLLQE